MTMYNPKIWYDGDIVTSGGLNNIEQGIAQNAHDIEDLQGALGGDLESYVNGWLDSHPEATTTVQDGSLTESKFSDSLKLKTINGYVTPEMFGAVGDGVTDDSNSFVSLFQSGYKIIQFGAKKTYKILSHITIGDEVEIYGNGATLQGGLNSLFNVTDTCHSFHMEDVHFEIGGSSETVVDNYCIAFNSNSENPVKWGQCQNIEIRNCTFNGGTFHIVLNYATNSLIESCVFYDSYVNPSHDAGGYSVLLQSSWDTTIKNCRFISGQYNRHSIYVSVYRAVELPCENTVITENIFDNTNIGTVSTTTISVCVRGNKNLILANNVFIKSVGFTITNSDFDSVGQHIYSNSFYEVPYFDSTNYPLQNRYTINVMGNASNKMEVNIHDNVQYSLDTTRLGNKVYIGINNATSAIVTNNKALTTSGIILFDSHVMIDGFASMKRNEAVIVYSACTGYVRNLQTLDASGWSARAISVNNGRNVDIDFVPPEYVKYSYVTGTITPIRKEGLPITVSVDNELLTIDLPWCNTSKLWGKYNSLLTIARLTRNSESIGGFTGYIRDTGGTSIQSTDSGMLEIFKWR